MFKSLFGNWSLEQKCLFYLGMALLAALILGAVAVQFVAERLVKETTRQSARDFANSVIWSKHLSADSNAEAGIFDREGSSKDSFSILLRLKDGLEHQDLGGSIAIERDLELITRIHTRLAELEARTKTNSTQIAPSPQDTASASSNSATWEALANPTNLIFEESGPIDGYYIYYHPIVFKDSCRGCHQRNITLSQPKVAPVSVDPFRVLQVRIPSKDTSNLRVWSYSLLSSIAIATLAISLLFIHWVLKRLVINPLSELKTVSEEITKGKTDLEFHVDTDDEFSELSESFNRMLQSLTNAQKTLESVNTELDSRIDELASVNLQLFEANRLKGEFLANMSHELRTPLNSILGFSDVLAGIETLTDKQRRWVGNIQNSGRVLLEMINDILDLAKIEAGKMEVRASEFDLLTVLEAQVEIFRKMAEDRNIDIQLDSNTEELRIVQDQSKIAQILTNLLSNAIKFTPEGGLVTIAADRQGEDNFFITIADTGIGIAEHEHEVIFEKFRQASGINSKDSLTREHSGTGLGLSIVREICRLLGGDITLTSKIGQGSTFRVVLPSHYSHLR